MFGLPSLSKILILVAIISAIWFGFRLLSQLDRQRRDVARKDRASRARGARAGEVDDMVKCEVCGTFIARGGKRCSNPACPV